MVSNDDYQKGSPSLISIKIQSCISIYSQNQSQSSLQTHPKLKLATKNKNSVGVEPNNKLGGRNPGVNRVVGEKNWGWERRRNCCEWEMGSTDKYRDVEGWWQRRWSRWVVGEDWWCLVFWIEGGAVELRFVCGPTTEHGLRFGGRRRQSVLGLLWFFIYVFFLVLEKVFFFFNIVLMWKIVGLQRFRLYIYR